MARTGGARMTIRGYVPQPDETMLVDYNLVGTDYFAAVGMKVLAGRVFTEGDNEFAPGVAIVNETLARRYFGRPGRHRQDVFRRTRRQRDVDFDRGRRQGCQVCASRWRGEHVLPAGAPGSDPVTPNGHRRPPGYAFPFVRDPNPRRDPRPWIRRCPF
jgi:MacB-like periplasmic core domain